MNSAVAEEERRGRRFCGLKSDNIFIGLSSDHPIVESSVENKSDLEIQRVNGTTTVPSNPSSSSSSSCKENGQDGVVGKVVRKTNHDEPYVGNSILTLNRIDKVRAAKMKESHSLDFSQVEVPESKAGRKQYRQMDSLNNCGQVDLPESKLGKKTYSHTHGCRILLG